MNIRQNLTVTNFNKISNKINKYIVIHYVGAVSTAWANSVYFKYANRNASAHYFVDDNEIVQVVDDSNASWHCGDKLKNGNGGKYYGRCTNSNSIGIEMCCYSNNGKLDISMQTISNTIELVKMLMTKYNIPAENVIRHYDVTNKICPAPFVENGNRWLDFKAKLGQTVDKTVDNTETNYTVKINTADLNVRDGAGVNYKINTVVHQNEIYTIVAEKDGWGKLKSGAGWINLKYTVKPDTTQYYPACAKSYVGLADALKSIGVDSSLAYRKKIAVANGVYNYSGTAVQNNQLLAKLKAGKLKKI